MRNKLLLTGLYAPGSGLTNVVSVLMRELGLYFDVQGLGFSPGQNGTKDVEVWGFPMRVEGQRAPVFIADPEWLDAYMRCERPEAVLVTGPAFLVTTLLRQLQHYRERTRILLYLPTEGKIVNKEAIAETLDLVDTCILYTKYAMANVKELCEDAVSVGINMRVPSLCVAGHGVDASDFFPLGGIQRAEEMRSRCKRELFPDRPELHRGLMVLNANRPYYRKRLDVAIAGFGIFARDRSDVFLYLHTGKISTEERAELNEQIAATGVGEQILLNVLNEGGGKLPVTQLNQLYNACDMGLTTAMGEGWGLGSFEHAATGAAQVMPDHTSFAENWAGSAVLVPTTGTEHVFYELADMFVVSPHDVAAALAQLYDDNCYREEIALAGYEQVMDVRYKWSEVGRVFREVVVGAFA